MTNQSNTLAVLRAIASINGHRTIKPLAKLSDIRERVACEQVRTAILHLRQQGWVAYVDTGALDGYVITPAGEALLQRQEVGS